MSDRRTTTTGGLERVEVRLQDVIDRSGRNEPQPRPMSTTALAPAAAPGTVFLPLADLQALILNVGDAERRAMEATNRAAVTDGEAQRLADALARAEAGLAAAQLQTERLRRRVGELEVVAIGGTAQPNGVDSETERLREHVTRLEAKMAESRSEVDGQRRRIRELENCLAAPAEATVGAEAEAARLREQLKRHEARLATARNELDGQRRRIRDLEALATPAEGALAAEAENDRLREHVARLEMRLAEARNELDGQRPRIRELEALAMPAKRALAAEAENERLREDLRRFEAEAAEAGDELEGQRRRIRELETSPETGTTVAAGDRSPPRRPPSEPSAADSTSDRAEGLRPQPMPSGSGRAAPSAATTQVKAVVQRWRRGPEISEPALGPDLDPSGADLRRLYRRLQTRQRDQSQSPDERRRWIADLAAYDETLVLACVRLGVPTGFGPGDRLPADERARLTRELGEAGLDVRQQAS